MIRFVIQDSHRSVDLFRENQTDHLVGECHAGEGDLFRIGSIHAGREAVRAADDKNQALDARSHLFLYPGGELH